jgi:hypothetical protein
MGRNKNYSSDGFAGKISFWTEQLALAQTGEGRYTLDRATESLAYFRGRRNELLAQANELMRTEYGIVD